MNAIEIQKLVVGKQITNTFQSALILAAVAVLVKCALVWADLSKGLFT